MSDLPLVLVADDDALLRAILEHKLKRSGYEVLAVEDGRAAMKALEQVTPAAVILDAMMPILDGFEVLRRIRAEPKFDTLPVVMLSSLRRENDIVEALQAGASDYLVKPFIPEELVIRLSRLALVKPGDSKRSAA